MRRKCAAPSSLNFLVSQDALRLYSVSAAESRGSGGANPRPTRGTPSSICVKAATSLHFLNLAGTHLNRVDEPFLRLVIEHHRQGRHIGQRRLDRMVQQTPEIR